VFLLPGDNLSVTVQDRATKTQVRFVEEIERTVEVDTVVTFDCDDVLGVSGIGAVMGKQVN